MNHSNLLFESYAWIVLAVGMFVGGFIAGISLASLPPKAPPAPPDIWKPRFAKLNKKT